MVGLYYQLDGIYNHCGNKRLRMPVRVFLDWVEAGRYTLSGLSPSLSKGLRSS